MPFFRTKTFKEIDDNLKRKDFKRVLNGFDLLLLCVGCTIASGIFVLTGVSAAKFAGPAIVFSFLISGVICIFTALAYAELASIVPISGSAYTYTFFTMGEVVAWIVGWSLVLEYILCASTVASGWSGYMVGIVKSAGFDLPEKFTKGPFSGGIVNLPAVLITIFVMALLIKGTRESSIFNRILVAIKLLTIFIFVYVASGHFHPSNWENFFPYGVNGMMTGAAIIFYAYVGFDSVTTTAEECEDPRKDIPIGLIGGLLVCTILYMLVAATLTGIVPYYSLNNAEPLAYALRINGSNLGSALVATGAVAGITTSLLIMMYGQSRIFFVMSRDQLLPKFFSKLHHKYGTPHISTIFTGVVVASLAGVFPIDIMGSLSSLGTLFAFSIVSLGVMVLRIKSPEIIRPFKCPAIFIIAPISIVSSFYLITQLIKTTGITFLVWSCLGISFYFVYGFASTRFKKKSIVKEEEESPYLAG